MWRACSLKVRACRRPDTLVSTQYSRYGYFGGVRGRVGREIPTLPTLPRGVYLDPSRYLDYVVSSRLHLRYYTTTLFPPSPSPSPPSSLSYFLGFPEVRQIGR